MFELYAFRGGMASCLLLTSMSLLAQLTTVSSFPSSKLEKRNVCDWVDAEPVLYKQYYDTDCPPAKQLQPDGSCEVHPTDHFDAGSCENYCQIRTNYFYGQEQPFPNSYCHGPLTCTITQTATTTYNWNINIPISVRLKDIFSIGITGGIGSSVAVAVARSTSVKLDPNSCGYFTFLPIIHESCGSFTQATLNNDNGNIDTSKWTCVNPQTWGNICTSQMATNNDGGFFSNPTTKGDTIFVKTDCGTREPLPMEDQDPAYQHAGVALPRAMYEAYSATWENGASQAFQATPPTCDVVQDSPKTIDCQDALSQLFQSSEDNALQGKSGGTWWASYVNYCAIEILYDQDWDASCSVSMAEVLDVAFNIYDNCQNNATGQVDGVRTLRADGKCNSRLAITEAIGEPPQGVP